MRDFFRRNIGLKLISLFIAISLETYFMSPQNLVTETISASVDIQGLSDDLMIVWPPAADEGLLAACKIRGPGPLIQETRSTPRRFTISLPPKPSETFVAELNASQLKLPSGIELLEVQPAKFELRIEPVIEKALNVKVKLSGDLDPGLRLESVGVGPETVLAHGPQGELSPIADIETEPIDLSQQKGSVTLDVPLRERGGRTTLRRRTVRVDLHVAPVLAEKILSNVKVSVEAPDGFAASVTPTRVKAVVSGNSSALEKISESNTQLHADLTGLSLSQVNRSVERVNLVCPGLPSGVKLLSTIPSQVEVTLLKKEVQ